MPNFATRRRVPFTPKQMYDLVAAVEQYPEFLPLIEDLRVKSRSSAEEGDALIADMTVGYKAIRETFTSRVLLKPATPEVLVSYIDGPFKYLENRWQFQPGAGGGTDVHFHIDYEFRNPMLGMLVGAVFEKAFRKFTEAFETRARAVYGDPIADVVAG